MRLSLRLPVLLVLLSCRALADEPLEQAFVPGAAAYFRADHLTGATYLRLGADGSYEMIAVEHMGQFPTDHGRWQSEGSRLLLRSDRRVLDVTSSAFRIYLGSRRDVSLLPRLKESVLALHARLKGRPVDSKAVTALQVSEGEGPTSASAEVTLDVGIELGAGHAPASSLLELASAIEAYLADAERQSVFPYRRYSYRGHTFLVPLAPGAAAVEFTPTSVRRDIDENEGGPPPYVFLAVPESEYEKGVRRGYPFKFYPELNPPD